jgi:putative ABC transport system permease protein
MAHSLMTNIQALRTYYNCLQQDSLPYYTLLGNGASRPAALAPYITRALKSMVMPTIANLSAMGLFVMPMLLSGMLLGGMNALEAVSVFVVLMLACIATALLSLILTLVLADRRSFNRQGQLESVFTVD